MHRRSTAVSVQHDDPRGALFSLGSPKNYIFCGHRSCSSLHCYSVILLHFYNRPHMAPKARKFLQNFCWEKAVPFSYSPGLAPRNSRLFLQGTFRDIVLPAMTMPNTLSSRGSRKSVVAFYASWMDKLITRF